MFDSVCKCVIAFSVIPLYNIFTDKILNSGMINQGQFPSILINLCLFGLSPVLGLLLLCLGLVILHVAFVATWGWGGGGVGWGRGGGAGLDPNFCKGYQHSADIKSDH